MGSRRRADEVGWSKRRTRRRLPTYRPTAPLKRAGSRKIRIDGRHWTQRTLPDADGDTYSSHFLSPCVEADLGFAFSIAEWDRACLRLVGGGGLGKQVEPALLTRLRKQSLEGVKPVD